MDETILAALQQSVDDFHKITFPTYCKGMDIRLETIERKIDKGNGDLAELKKWRIQLEAVGWAMRNQWVAVIAGIGLTATVVELLDRFAK